MVGPGEYTRALTSRPPKCRRSAVPADAAVGKHPRLEAWTPLAQGLDCVDVASMNAVVNASATAAGASRGPAWRRGSGRRPAAPAAAARPGGESPPHRLAGPRIKDMVALADAGRAERRLSHREPGEHLGRLARIAERQRPAVGALRRLQRDRRAEAAVHEGALEAPLLQQLGHEVHRIPLADAAEVDANAVGCRAHFEGIRVDLERRQAGADGDVERAVGQVVDVPGDEEAFERGFADAGALCRRSDD